MTAKVGVITFPGTLDDVDAARAVRYAARDLLAGSSHEACEAVSLWHGDADLAGVDAVVVPGGFSYGDYLRAGAIARFAPVMGEVIEAARKGMPVLGICNGFQVLCEAGLLPGALVRNHKLHFVCRDQWLRVENTSTAWTTRYEHGAEILIPVKNGEGAYMADEPTLDALENEDRVVFRYVGETCSQGRTMGAANPNGSRRDIAGITDPTGRIVGLMPHPEHAIDALTGPSDDGLGMFLSALDALQGAPA
ncbi:phosphoribosylformylglycinamidine synthase subunit PurQ [Haloechinothrix halophila]|uniref:phosphoribosylformylglycinamidine synthase subunit PurQ n=1 Tax=Haloechinothrix halophila TaxID=1069073 RepID=UPI00041FAE0B|nr:phosphoribosylformylglycinamidine synthase subunit PurQ [Haloechinothrix halophila]